MNSTKLFFVNLSIEEPVVPTVSLPSPTTFSPAVERLASSPIAIPQNQAAQNTNTGTPPEVWSGTPDPFEGSFFKLLKIDEKAEKAKYPYILIQCDFDGTMTGEVGSKTTSRKFFKALTIRDTRYFHLQDKVNKMVAAEFDRYFQKHGKIHPAAITPRAAEFIQCMASNKFVKFAFFTRNGAPYLKAVLAHAGISTQNIEIHETDYQKGITKFELSVNWIDKVKKEELVAIFQFEDNPDDLVHLQGGAKKSCKDSRLEADILSHLCRTNDIDWVKHAKDIEQIIEKKQNPVPVDQINLKI